MRARNRHSASGYLFAAILELVIMGIFVVIAQPQLRNALFELLDPPAQTLATPDPVAATTSLHQSRLPEVQPLLGSTPNIIARPMAQPASWSMNTAGYTPLEQFESFAVSSSGAPVPATAGSVAGERRVAGYAPMPGATQLDAIDWNIASAAQSPRPLSGWTAARPPETDYRDTYPPPYGTQSQWK